MALEGEELREGTIAGWAAQRRDNCRLWAAQRRDIAGCLVGGTVVPSTPIL